jgi:hypothetical protein
VLQKELDELTNVRQWTAFLDADGGQTSCRK